MGKCEREGEQEGDECSEEHLLWSKCTVSSVACPDSDRVSTESENGKRKNVESVRCVGCPVWGSTNDDN